MKKFEVKGQLIEATTKAAAKHQYRKQFGGIVTLSDIVELDKPEEDPILVAREEALHICNDWEQSYKHWLRELANAGECSINDWASLCGTTSENIKAEEEKCQKKLDELRANHPTYEQFCLAKKENHSLRNFFDLSHLTSLMNEEHGDIFQ